MSEINKYKEILELILQLTEIEDDYEHTLLVMKEIKEKCQLALGISS